MYKKYDPKLLKDFVGQTKIVQDITINIQAARTKDEPLEHTLFTGSAGLGKSSLARIVANEMKSRIYEIPASAFKDFSQLDYIFYTLKKHDIVFIDEIHGLRTGIAEAMYTLLETGVYNRIKIKPFTLIGATNYAGNIDKPLRDRFVHKYVFEKYTNEEIASILLLNGATKDIAKEISKRSRGIPRIARHFLAKISNDAYSKNITLDKVNPNGVFERLDVDENGLMKDDLSVLDYLIHNGATQSSRAIGERAVCMALGIEIVDYRTIIEPYLLQLGLIGRTPRGRVITVDGIDYINKEKL